MLDLVGAQRRNRFTHGGACVLRRLEQAWHVDGAGDAHRGGVSLPDTWVYALRVPHDPRAARVARMTARAALGGHGRHTRRPCSLRLTALSDGRLRVGVWDSHPHIPAPFAEPPDGHRTVPAPADAGGGRGLHLVQACADSWGGWSLGDDLLGRGTGKPLWFEVRCP